MFILCKGFSPRECDPAVGERKEKGETPNEFDSPWKL